MNDATPLREWAADKVERWPLEKIIPYERNARAHSDDQVRQLADSMRKFGVTTPVLVDEAGVLIYGHGRLAAARLAGFDSLPVAIAVGWSEEDKRAYRIADNQLALTSTWDMPTLKAELADLKMGGFDMPVLGFTGLQLVQFMANPKEKEVNQTFDLPPDPVTQPGDIWIMESHRLMCGNACETEDVLKLYGNDRPHLLVTDPPYGVDYDPAWRVGIQRPRQSEGHIPMVITNAVTNDDQVDWTTVWMNCGCAVLYVWHAATMGSIVDRSIRQAGYNIRAQLVWKKAHFALGRGDYHWQHESCLYAVRRDSNSHWQGSRTQSTVWDINSPVGFTAKEEGPDGKTGHGTQKPVECMKRPIENNSAPGEFVYDPFVGSGTTIIAAELAARRCLAMEISPAYADMSVRRWQEISGKSATLKSDGRDFEAVAAERRGQRGA